MSNQHDIDILQHNARQLDLNHDLKGAMDGYLAVIRADPGRDLARTWLIRLLMENSRFSEAHHLCDSGLSGGASARLLAAKSQLHQTEFRSDDAIRLAQRATEVDLNCGDAWYALTTAMNLAGREAESSMCLDKGLAVAPEHVELLVEDRSRPTHSPRAQCDGLAQLHQRFPGNRTVWLSYLIALFSVDEREESAHHLRRLLIHTPKNHALHGVEGLHRFIKGDVSGAFTSAQRGLSLWPKSFFALFARFQVYLHRDEVALALEDLEFGHQLTLKTSTHSVFVTQMFTSVGLEERARSHLEDSISGQRDNITSRLALCEMNESYGDYDAVLTATSAMSDAERKRYDVVGLTARALVEQERYGDAKPWVDKLDKNAETDLYRIRIAASKLRTADEVKALYTQHLERYPRLDYAWGLLFREAAEMADLNEIQRLTQPPFEVPALVPQAALAYAYAHLGQFENARRCVESVLTIQTVPRRWIWAWEFALEAAETQELQAYHTAVRATAFSDGYVQ